jgi:LAO/AO transport system kinase
VSRAEPLDLLDEAHSGSRVALARLLTIVESGGTRHRELVAAAYAVPPPYVLGLTGPPGAGKSTLVDGLIATGLEVGDRGGPLPEIAVVAIDPSSPFTGGAILGDRVRMQSHATDERVYIRSMATRGHLGGLSLAVPDATRVLGRVGFALVVVETVGVGQMEVDIASAADSTVVVLNPGWGDSMQANKAGLLEVADVFVVNKADRPLVRETRRDLEQMLDLGESRPWRPPIIETIATSATGVAALWAAVNDHRSHLEESGELATRRRRRTREGLIGVLAAESRARSRALAHGERFEAAVDAIAEGTIDPYRAADELLD